MKSYKTIWINGVQKRLHRYVMECALGRALSSDEMVHHINEDKLDNRLENLQIMTRAEHCQLHQKAYSPKTRFQNKYDIRVEEVTAFVLASETVAQIAKRYDCSDTTIQRIVDSNKLRELVPKIYCSVCGETALYKKNKLCKKHYFQQYHQNKKR